MVRHEGREVDFDWEHQSADTIQWAPFYSDCEHEIKTITHGERITLTYNLYITTGPLDTVNPSTSILDPKTLPLYQEIKNVLEMPGFLKTGTIQQNLALVDAALLTDIGGVLGSFCTHAYPHTADNATTLLPRGLKGADLVLYSVFDSLGIEVEMLPVIIGSGENDYYYGSSSNDDGSSSNDYSSSNDKHGSDDDYYTYAKLDEKVHIGLWLEPHFSADNWEDDPVSQVGLFSRPYDLHGQCLSISGLHIKHLSAAFPNLQPAASFHNMLHRSRVFLSALNFELRGIVF
jgi:hypothetical protein